MHFPFYHEFQKECVRVLTVRTRLCASGGVNALNKEPEKPKITVETKTQEVSIGGSAMLELKVEGCPKPEIAW